MGKNCINFLTDRAEPGTAHDHSSFPYLPTSERGMTAKAPPPEDCQLTDTNNFIISYQIKTRPRGDDLTALYLPGSPGPCYCPKHSNSHERCHSKSPSLASCQKRGGTLKDGQNGSSWWSSCNKLYGAAVARRTLWVFARLWSRQLILQECSSRCASSCQGDDGRGEKRERPGMQVRDEIANPKSERLPLHFWSERELTFLAGRRLLLTLSNQCQL